MNKLFFMILIFSSLSLSQAFAKLNEPGYNDPEDHGNHQAEVKRQQEEAKRRQESLNTRTMEKEREIEERAISLLAASGNKTKDFQTLSEKLDEIELGDVIVDQVNQFKLNSKIKLQEALNEKKSIIEEENMDSVFKNLTI